VRRAGRRAVPRLRLPVAPLASLAIALLGTVTAAGLFSAARGPALRFATFDEAGGFSKERAIRVDLQGDGAVLLNGAPIPKDALVGAVASDLSVQPGAGVILVVAADVPYKTMLAAYGGIAALPDHPRIALPPRAWVEAATRARGGSQAQ
jgi:biopolymer transport protein ExbD